MKNCIYEPVFGLFLLFNFQIDSALTFSSRLIYVVCHISIFLRSQIVTLNVLLLIVCKDSAFSL